MVACRQHSLPLRCLGMPKAAITDIPFKTDFCHNVLMYHNIKLNIIIIHFILFRIIATHALKFRFLGWQTADSYHFPPPPSLSCDFQAVISTGGITLGNATVRNQDFSFYSKLRERKCRWMQGGDLSELSLQGRVKTTVRQMKSLEHLQSITP